MYLPFIPLSIVAFIAFFALPFLVHFEISLVISSFFCSTYVMILVSPVVLVWIMRAVPGSVNAREVSVVMPIEPKRRPG